MEAINMYAGEEKNIFAMIWRNVKSSDLFKKLDRFFAHPAVTFLFIIVFVAGSQFEVIYIDRLKITEILKTNPLLNLIDFTGGGSLSSGSVFMISIIFMILSGVVVNYMSSGIPFYKNLAQYEKSRFRMHALAVDFIAAAVFSIWLAVFLIRNGILIPGDGIFLSSVLLLMAGVLIMRIITAGLNKSALGLEGVQVLLAAGFLLSIFRWLSAAVTNPEFTGLRIWMVIAGIFAAAAAGAIYIENSEARIKFDSSRFISRSGRGYSSNYFPLKINSPFGGGLSLREDRNFPALLMLLISFLFEILRFASADMTSVLKILVGIIVPLFISFIYLFHTALKGKYLIKNLTDQLRKNEDFIPGVRPGNSTYNYIGDKFSKLIGSASVFVVLGFLCVQIVNITVLPVPLHPLTLVSLWAIAELFHNIYDGFKLYKTERNLNMR